MRAIAYDSLDSHDPSLHVFAKPSSDVMEIGPPDRGQGEDAESSSCEEESDDEEDDVLDDVDHYVDCLLELAPALKACYEKGLNEASPRSSDSHIESETKTQDSAFASTGKDINSPPTTYSIVHEEERMRWNHDYLDALCPTATSYAPDHSPAIYAQYSKDAPDVKAQDIAQGSTVISEPRMPQCWDHGCKGRAFSTFSNLLRHKREKVGISTKFPCPNCGAAFTRITARDGHLAHDKCKDRPGADP